MSIVSDKGTFVYKFSMSIDAMWLLLTLLNCLSSKTNENELVTVYSLVENGAKEE